MECLAATGTNKYYYVVAACVLVAAAALLLLARRRTGKGARFWMIGLVLSAAVFAAATPNQTFAAGVDCQAVDGSVTPGAITSTPGSTSAAAGAPQAFNAMAHVTPSSGATVVASSLRLALVDAPLAGSTLSADGLTVTVPGEGVYQANSDGTITFTPEEGFVGVGRGVRFMFRDSKGSTTVNVYSPTVTAPPVVCQGVYLGSASIDLIGLDGSYFGTTSTLHVPDYLYYSNGDDLPLDPADKEAVMPYIDFDPSSPGIQTTVDHTVDQGWHASYDPMTGDITRVITDTELFKNYVTLVDIAMISIGFAGTPELCGFSDGVITMQFHELV